VQHYTQHNVINTLEGKNMLTKHICLRPSTAPHYQSYIIGGLIVGSETRGMASQQNRLLGSLFMAIVWLTKLFLPDFTSLLGYGRIQSTQYLAHVEHGACPYVWLEKVDSHATDSYLLRGILRTFPGHYLGQGAFCGNVLLRQGSVRHGWPGSHHAMWCC
jgi:hypothetical protein